MVKLSCVHLLHSIFTPFINFLVFAQILFLSKNNTVKVLQRIINEALRLLCFTKVNLVQIKSALFMLQLASKTKESEKQRHIFEQSEQNQKFY